MELKEQMFFSSYIHEVATHLETGLGMPYVRIGATSRIFQNQLIRLNINKARG